MAMEDGLELARCLRDIPDVPKALATYERLRQERVEQVVAHGARMSGFKLGGPVARMMRDLVLPWILQRQTQTTNPAQMVAMITPIGLALQLSHRVERIVRRIEKRT